MKALEFWMHCIPFTILLHSLTLTQAWKRSALIYNNDGRDMEAWKRHMMRVDADGSFTGQWLFDAAILTTSGVNDKDIYYGHSASSYLNGQDLKDLISMLFREAMRLEHAIESLSSEFGPPPSTLQIFIGYPYLHPANTNLNINGDRYDLSSADRRISASRWCLDNILKKFSTREWKYFNFGIYYHREDVLRQYEDHKYIQRLNEHIHDHGISSLWVPYYDSPTWAFNGTGLGFDYTVIQPRYSFLSSIDAGILKGDRLYSTGYKAAGQGQCMEYEARSQGESDLEYYMAHQNLAISQFTGASQNEQVFFVGNPDIFDKVTDQESSPGKMWDTYTDLTNYLGGGGIWNMEVGIDFRGFKDVNANLKELSYVINGNYLRNMNSIRLDFKDAQLWAPWRGGMNVLIKGDRTKSSFAYRVGYDDVNPDYNSVFVPLSNFPIPSGTNLVIQLTREENSPWPNILRMVAAKYEPLFVANPAFGAVSRSSAEVPTHSYQDSEPTQAGFAAGKLTDGRKLSIWWEDNAVGWRHQEKRVTITIDLGEVKPISYVRVHGWHDLPSGIGWPRRAGVLAAVDCEPQERGTLNGCVPTASSGNMGWSMSTNNDCGSFCFTTTLTGTFAAGVRARYITVSMVAINWLMLDEVEVLDENNAVISTGMPYRVTPVPGLYYNAQHRDWYSSDGQTLSDGAIFKDFIFGRNVVGFPHDEEGTVEVTWIKPVTSVTYAVVWMTNAHDGWGIGLPANINIQWRDANGAWQAATTVMVNAINPNGVCTASPCGALRLPKGARVTGVRGIIPETGHWTMVSEVSLV